MTRVPVSIGIRVLGGTGSTASVGVQAEQPRNQCHGVSFGHSTYS